MLSLIAAFAPKIIGLVTGGDTKADKVLGVAADLAESLTGKKGDAAVAAINADPKLQLEFQKALMADKHIEEEMRYADVDSAREMFQHNNTMQADLAKSIMKWNLPYIAFLVAINAAIMIWTPPAYAPAAQAVGTILGMVIQSLLKERQDLVGFSFGSSAGSKNKELGK